MANESSTIVQKLWNFCNVLRDDGVGYNDYVEQLTYLLFLKMIDEQAQLPPPFGKPSTIPEEHNWQSLRSKSGDDLEIHYRKTLESLAKEKGLLGVIFRKSQNKIQDPAKLERLIALINDETWFSLDVDVKGAIYESLRAKLELMERNSRELPPLESLITKTEFERAKEDLWAELTRLDSAVAMVGNFYQLTYNDQFSNDELEGDAAPVDYFPDTQEEYTQGVLEIETAQPTVSKSEEAIPRTVIICVF